MTTEQASYQALISAARNPHDMATLTFAGVIATKSRRKQPYDVPISGLEQHELQSLKEGYFPNAPFTFVQNVITQQSANRADEFDDLLALLLEHRSFENNETRWLAHAVATASMAENHLWEDMGLINRMHLSKLLAQYFTRLASRNTDDMKWKKFFYLELCKREGLSICRAPSCGVCKDYQHCFGPEEPASNSIFLLNEP